MQKVTVLVVILCVSELLTTIVHSTSYGREGGGTFKSVNVPSYETIRDESLDISNTKKQQVMKHVTDATAENSNEHELKRGKEYQNSHQTELKYNKDSLYFILDAIVGNNLEYNGQVMEPENKVSRKMKDSNFAEESRDMRLSKELVHHLVKESGSVGSNSQTEEYFSKQGTDVRLSKEREHHVVKRDLNVEMIGDSNDENENVAKDDINLIKLLKDYGNLTNSGKEFKEQLLKLLRNTEINPHKIGNMNTNYIKEKYLFEVTKKNSSPSHLAIQGIFTSLKDFLVSKVNDGKKDEDKIMYSSVEDSFNSAENGKQVIKTTIEAKDQFEDITIKVPENRISKSESVSKSLTSDKVFSLAEAPINTSSLNNLFHESLREGKEVIVDAVQVVTDHLQPADVCFDDLGCFDMGSPWFTLLRPIPPPKSPVKIDTRFYLYTRKHQKNFTVIKNPSISLYGSGYDGKKKTYFIVHGFATHGNATWLSDMKDAILGRYDGNVFIVDWGKGACWTNYFQVAANTRVVGAELARLGNYLINKKGADASRFHIIGHSLGAQASAYMAKNISDFGRITALDPAQPGFEGYDKIVRLDISDAQYIDVIHTTARPLIPFIGLGMVHACGHVDFYLNGGWHQPGCVLSGKPPLHSFMELATLTVEAISHFIACPHGRAYEYLTASLLYDNCSFWGHRITKVRQIITIVSRDKESMLTPEACTNDTCIQLGFDAVRYPAKGSFTVVTSAQFPYCNLDLKAERIMKNYRNMSEEILRDPDNNTLRNQSVILDQTLP